MAGAKVKRTAFYDTRKNRPIYGIDIKLHYSDRWMRAGDNDGPYLFTTEAKREAKIVEIRAEIKAKKRTLVEHDPEAPVLVSKKAARAIKP